MKDLRAAIEDVIRHHSVRLDTMSQDSADSYLCKSCTTGGGAYARPTYGNSYSHPTSLVMEIVTEFLDDKDIEEFIRNLKESLRQETRSAVAEGAAVSEPPRGCQPPQEPLA